MKFRIALFEFECNLAELDIVLVQFGNVTIKFRTVASHLLQLLRQFVLAIFERIDRLLEFELLMFEFVVVRFQPLYCSSLLFELLLLVLEQLELAL